MQGWTEITNLQTKNPQNKLISKSDQAATLQKQSQRKYYTNQTPIAKSTRKIIFQNQFKLLLLQNTTPTQIQIN